MPAEEMVVTATRNDTPVDRIGSSVTILGESELEGDQIREVAEALRDVPGFAIVQTGSRGGTTSLFVRGGESDHNLVMLDGIQLNGGGGSFDFARLTPDNVARIEIVRGPASALYGSDALASAINLVSRPGEGPPRAELSFFGGAHGTVEQSLELSGGVGAVGASLGLSRYETDGILDLNNDADNTTVRSRFDWDVTERAALGLTVAWGQGTFHFPTDFVSGVRGGFAPVDPRQRSESKDLVVGLFGDVDLADGWVQHVQLSLVDSESVFADPFDPIDSDFTSFRRTNDERRWSADAHQTVEFDLTASVASRVIAGLEIELQEFDQEGLSTPPGEATTRTALGAERDTIGGYAQAELAFVERFFLTMGVRADRNSKFGTAVNPRATAAWRLMATGTRLRAAAGTGFKEPRFNENFGTSGIPGNPDLDPEESFSWEAGIDQELSDGRFLGWITYFANDYDNLITLVGDFSAPGRTWQNIQAAETSGLEIGLEAGVTGAISVGGQYTYLDTKVVDDGGIGGTAFPEGRPLLRRPRHSGSFWLDARWDRLRIRLTGTAVGTRIDRDFGVFPEVRLENDGYVKVDLSTAIEAWDHEPSGTRVRLRLLVENLLDESYEEAFGFESPGIGAFGGIEVRFG